MSIEKLNTQLEFNTKVGELEAAATDTNKWIYDDMNTSEKSGRFWRYFHTIFRLIGIDVYSHVRVNKVAEEMVEFAKNNKDYLDANNGGKLVGVLHQLNTRTDGKYGKTVEDMQLAIKGILFDKTPTPTTPTTPPSEVPPPPPIGIPPPPAGLPPPPTGRPAASDLLSRRNALKKASARPVTAAGDAAAKGKTQIGGGLAGKLAQQARDKRGSLNHVDPADGSAAKPRGGQQVDFRDRLKRTDSAFRLQDD